jgi:hypothetical protein
VDPVVVLAVRVSLSLLFAAAAAHKLRDRRAFRRTLRRYDVLPAALVGPASAALVTTEVVLAAWLPFSAAAAVVAAAVLALYGGAMALNLARGRRDLDCGCMGPAKAMPIHGALVARNAVLAALALLSAAPAAERPLVWIDALTVAAAVATAAACWLATERMLALVPAAARLRGAR